MPRERNVSLVKSLEGPQPMLEVRGRDSEAAPGEKWSARWGWASGVLQTKGGDAR